MPSSSSTLSHTSTDRQNASSTPTQGRNPITLRLYKILGTSFDDVATREALHTLSEFYSQTSSSGDKPPDSGVDGTDGNEFGIMKKSGPSGVVSGELAAKARKNFRRDMENKLAEGSQQFMKVLGEVNEKVEELQRHVDQMRASCDDAEGHLDRTKEASKELLERAGTLREERKEAETKKLIATVFLQRFTLTMEELEAITERDVLVGPRFFAAMDKTERIRDDCRLLMSGDDGTPTQAGVDIMAATSSHLEQGYEKIFRWCSNEFRQLSRDVQYEVNPTLCECVQRLRKRPELLSEALSILSETRQATLLTSFTTALTRGGPSGLPRPIELHAHDPMRYVGDMLAWVHQAIAAEREFLEALFGVKSDGRMVGSVRKFNENEEEEWIRELMDYGVGKLCNPLKIRVLQTVRSQESSIVSYKIANLVQFYLVTMRRTLGEDATVSKTLEEITDVAFKVFFDSIEAQGRALLRDLDDTSLSPSLAILDHCQILREIMVVYQSSFLGDEDETTRVSGFRKQLDIMVDPVLETIVSMSEDKKRHRPKWDQPVYVLNALTYLQTVLEPYQFTSEKREVIQGVVDGRVAFLINDHYENIMSDAGLEEAMEICEGHHHQEPLSHVPGMQPSDLQKALRHFSMWLSGPEVVHSSRLAQLTVQRYHAQIHQAALERVVRAYRTICEHVRSSENKYEAASTLLGSERPFGQVHLLWQIFGLEGDAPV
ncbi:oligomeric Golgi complex subunit 6 [Amanita rubescens]|nr:oligomeric Golgi complex subunit 6 [Amanita rubescens]